MLGFMGGIFPPRLNRFFLADMTKGNANACAPLLPSHGGSGYVAAASASGVAWRAAHAGRAATQLPEGKPCPFSLGFALMRTWLLSSLTAGGVMYYDTGRTPCISTWAWACLKVDGLCQRTNTSQVTSPAADAQ